MKYKSEFDSLPWQTPADGIRHKCFDQGGKRLRLVEYSDQMHEHWCEKGHLGIVLSGELEIDFFDGSSVRYKLGDALFLPDGADHSHRARILSGKATVFFVEEL